MAYQIDVTVRETSRNESRSRVFEVTDWEKVQSRLREWVAEQKKDIDAMSVAENREVV